MTGKKRIFLTTRLRCRQSAAFQASPSFARKKNRQIMPVQISNSYDFSFLFLYLYTICRIYLSAKRKIPAAGKDSGGSKTKKGTNAMANPSYVLRKFFFPHLLYILYHIFRRAQIFVGFFSQLREAWCCWRIFDFPEFLQKNKPCKACTAI